MKNTDITIKGAIMIVLESREKVKNKAIALINKAKIDLSNPDNRI
jgi:hypothetical protein